MKRCQVEPVTARKILIDRMRGENVHKRYLLHGAGHNLSLLMRQLIGAGTPKEAVAGGYGALFVLVIPTCIDQNP